MTTRRTRPRLSQRSNVEELCLQGTNKEKMAMICNILEIDTKILEMPRDGFSEESMNSGTRSFARGKRIVNRIVDNICDLISPSNPQFKKCLTGEDEKEVNNIDKKHLLSNATELVFTGSPYTQHIVKALLAKSFWLKELTHILNTEAESFNGDSRFIAMKKKALIGKRQFMSLKKSYNNLSSGKDKSKNAYKYRLDPSKFSTAIEFIQESLCLKAGVTRDVKFDGHLFKDMPVYERGGKSIRSLNDSYNASFDKDHRVGRDTFFHIAKFLTKRGESKAGLSTYYIQLRYSGNIFTRMMTRLLDFEYRNIQGKREVTEQCKSLLKEWKDVQMFVMWEYTNRHLKMSSSDPAHCCTYTLGGICTHKHNTRSCAKCNSCLDFFYKKVKGFLDYVVSRLGEDSESDEIKSMYRAIPILTYAIKHYMAHRLRAKVQFVAIDNEKESLKNDPTILYICIDHKQKILQIRFREGQVEYYGKTGMSDLGAMIMQWVVRKVKQKSANGTIIEKEVGGFEYSFLNLLFKDYTGQDHVQVSSAIEKIVSYVKEKYPEVKEIIIQSDNATCFASQEHIPFIYHMNKEFRTKNMPIISKWLFTEAQAGRGRLDTHFSYLNTVFKSFVEDGNDILTEEHVIDALAFDGGIAGTTGILLDCANLQGETISKKFKTSKVRSRSTHEIRWYDNKVEVYASSGITAPEIIPDSKLKNHKKKDLKVVVARSFVSEKPPLFIKADDSYSNLAKKSVVIDIESLEDKTVSSKKDNRDEKNWSKLKQKRIYVDDESVPEHDMNIERGDEATLSSSPLILTSETNNSSNNLNGTNSERFSNPRKKRNFDASVHGGGERLVINNDSTMSRRAKVFKDTLESKGIVSLHCSNDNIQVLGDVSDELKPKWAVYPGKNPYKMNLKCREKLKQLYDIGKKSKKQKITAERAYQILIDTVIFDDWEQQLVVTVPKIKSFFSTC